MRQTPCTYDKCPEPIVGRLRKYCRAHSRQASAIWKRQHPEWRTPWKKTDEERRTYFREYMRRYRQRKREGRAA